jgi:hypothetical protein
MSTLAHRRLWRIRVVVDLACEELPTPRHSLEDAGAATVG